MGWDEIRAWMNNAARTAAGVIAPPADSPGAAAVAGIRSILPGSGSFAQEFDRYNRDAAPSPLYSPTARFGSVVTDPAKPLQPAQGERERQMQMAMQMPMMAPIAYHASPFVFDKPSLSKVGTGEGAQAYTHALYASSSAPMVDAQYREGLLHKASNEHPTGAIYKWDIPDPSLNLDLPLSQQAPASLAALERAGIAKAMEPLSTEELAKAFLGSDYAKSFPGASDVQMVGRWLADGDLESIAAYAAKNPTASINNLFGGDTALAAMDRARFRMGGGEKLAQAMKEAGLPVAEYRGDTSGIRNYTIYDDTKITPLGRWPSLAEMMADEAARGGAK